MINTKPGQISFQVRSEEEYKRYIHLCVNLHSVTAFDREWMVREVNHVRDANSKLILAEVALEEVLSPGLLAGGTRP